MNVKRIKVIFQKFIQKFRKYFNSVAKCVAIVADKIKSKICKINVYELRKVFLKLLTIIILLIVCAIVIFVYNYVASRSMIVTDDFDHYNIINDMPNFINGERFHNAIEYAKWDCVSLGGRYFTMFIQCFFGLRSGIDYITNQATIMTNHIFIYFGSVLFVIFSLVHNFSICRKQILNQIIISLLIFTSFIIVFNCFNYYPQIFNWFPGATSYSIPLSCFLVSLGCMIYLVNYDNFFFVLFTFIFGTFSMGGSLCIVSTSLTILSIVLLGLLISRKMNIKCIALTINYFVFGLINIISPGNYNRRVITIGNKYSILDILNTSLIYISARIKTIFFNPFALIAMLILSGFISFVIIKYFKISYSYFVVFPLVILLPIATTLPIAVGFGNLSLYNQVGVYDRICFAIDFSLIVSFFYVFTLIYISIAFLTKNLNNPIICLCMMVIFCSLVFYKNKEYIFFNDIHIIEMADNILQKKYDSAYYEYIKMLTELESNRGNKYVTVSKPKTIVTHYYNFESRGYENEFFEIENLTFK